MNQMTIEQFKEAAEYFPPGRILPNRIVKIMKGNKRQKSRFLSDGCFIMIRGKRMWIVPEKDGKTSITIDRVKNITVTFNPYGEFPTRIFCHKSYNDFDGAMPEI